MLRRNELNAVMRDILLEIISKALVNWSNNFIEINNNNFLNNLFYVCFSYGQSNKGVNFVIIKMLSLFWPNTQCDLETTKTTDN